MGKEDGDMTATYGNKVPSAKEFKTSYVPEPERFIEKTVEHKSVERIKFKAIPFSKGYKIQVEVAFNPENPIHIDQFHIERNRGTNVCK